MYWITYGLCVLFWYANKCSQTAYCLLCGMFSFLVFSNTTLLRNKHVLFSVTIAKRFVILNQILSKDFYWSRRKFWKLGNITWGISSWFDLAPGALISFWHLNGGRLLGTGYLFFFWDKEECDISFDWIFCFKERFTHGDIIAEKLRRRPLFCRDAFSEKLKENGPRLIAMYVYSISAVTETENNYGRSLKCLSVAIS